MGVDDYGDSMAGVQGLLKKHEAFESDLAVHKQRVADTIAMGQQLIAADNHHKPAIEQRINLLQVCYYVAFLDTLYNITEPS